MSDEPRAHATGRRKRVLLTTALVLAAIAAETVVMRRRGYGVGLKTIVRCRDGHLFTTIWIPGASLKSLRFGIVRLQYCPVGRHFTTVRPLKDDELTEKTRSIAGLVHDVPIP
ncbi:hypothetical protein [Catenulispora subtropica]|uniref:Uncharacterized protein n=1 Tax=Catenulispora subtropica TaxID=450798 RepID=A0ABN2SI94_9ACTN